MRHNSYRWISVKHSPPLRESIVRVTCPYPLRCLGGQRNDGYTVQPPDLRRNSAWQADFTGVRSRRDHGGITGAPPCQKMGRTLTDYHCRKGDHEPPTCASTSVTRAELHARASADADFLTRGGTDWLAGLLHVRPAAFPCHARRVSRCSLPRAVGWPNQLGAPLGF